MATIVIGNLASWEKKKKENQDSYLNLESFRKVYKTNVKKKYGKLKAHVFTNVIVFNWQLR